MAADRCVDAAGERGPVGGRSGRRASRPSRAGTGTRTRPPTRRSRARPRAPTRACTRCASRTVGRARRPTRAAAAHNVDTRRRYASCACRPDSRPGLRPARGLDLRVPVRTLDQPHHQLPAGTGTRPPTQVGDPLDHGRRALLVRLDHEAEARPAVEVAILGERFEQVERQVEPLGLLGVDVEADVVTPRREREVLQHRQQFAPHALARRAAVTRMQRGQLDRDAGSASDRIDRGRVRRAGAAADRIDRVTIRREIAIGVARGQRGLAEHVVRITIAAPLVVAAVRERILDRLAGHELPAEHPHREVDATPDQRFAAAGDHARERRRQPARAVRRHELAGDDQPPRGRVDEQRRALPDVRVPVAATDLVADQRVPGRRVGDAQQRLGQTHQRDAFGRRQRELAHQRVDAAGLHALRAQRLDQAPRIGTDPQERVGRQRRAVDQREHAVGLGRPGQRVDARALRRPCAVVESEVEVHGNGGLRRRRSTVAVGRVGRCRRSV